MAWRASCSNPAARVALAASKPSPPTPELSIAPPADTNHRTGAVVLVLQADIADNLPGLGVNHSPEAQLAVLIKEVDLGLHPFARLGDVGR